MELEALFKAYEEESYQKIRGLIAAVDATIVPPQIFEALLAKIYKRSV